MGWVSAIFSGVGAVNQMSSDAKTAQLQQAEILDNQKLAYGAAADAVARGDQLSGRTRIQGSQLVGEQDVAYANSGVDQSVGTAANVQADTRAMSELDAKTQENNAAREAWGFQRYGLKYGQQASLAAQKASNQQAATFLTGAGRFASAAGSAYQQWGASTPSKDVPVDSGT